MRRKLTDSPDANLPAETGSGSGFAMTSALAERGEFQRHEQIDRASGPILPYVGFYSPKADNALDVRAALGGGVVEGTPYLLVGTDDGEERIYPAGTFGFVLIDEFPYWATLDEKFHVANAWLTRQGYSAKFEGEPVKENNLAVVLVLPGQSGELPEGLRPAVATLTTFRSTKVPFVKEHLDAVERTTKPAWAAAPANASIASMVKPRYRVVSEIVVERKTAKSTGRPYTGASARTNTATIAQLQALQAFDADPRCQKQVADVLRTFDLRVADIRRIAAETAKRGG